MISPLVSIIILNWNGWSDTLECLESIYKSNYSNYEIVIVDNHSDDRSISNIDRWAQKHDLKVLKIYGKLLNSKNYKKQKLVFNRIKPNKKLLLIKNEKNFGFARGNNIAIKQIIKENISKYIFLLNNDTIIDKGLISELVDISKKNNTHIIGPDIRDYYIPDKPQIKKYGKYNKLQVVDTLSGACVMIISDVFNKIGYLDTTYYLYFEDRDFCEKARKNNIYSWYYPSRNKVFHKIGRSSSKVEGLQFYYMTKNLFLFIRRYHFNAFGIFFLFYTLIKSFMNEFIKKGNINIFSPYIKGIIDGIILFFKNPKPKY